ncbi:MAG: hypothetical protein AAF412_01145 [Pseudomonadota bacterium]
MLVYLFHQEPPDTSVEDAGPQQTNVFEPNRPVRDVTPDDVLQPPEIETEMLERLPAVKPPEPPSRPPKPVKWTRPVVKVAGILESGGKIVQLKGIVPTKLDKVCEEASGGTWPCGRFAKTAFANFVRSRTLDCEAKDVSSPSLTTNCLIGTQDLSLWLVTNGWAEPEVGMFSDAQKQAQANERGIWAKRRP